MIIDCKTTYSEYNDIYNYLSKSDFYKLRINLFYCKKIKFVLILYSDKEIYYKNNKFYLDINTTKEINIENIENKHYYNTIIKAEKLYKINSRKRKLNKLLDKKV